jgi:capsule polysaccharide export protein KpsE/RkpR
MTELPTVVDLQWVGRTLLAIQDELLVTAARMEYVEKSMDRLDAHLVVLTTEVRALRREVGRMNDRVVALEARP